VPRRPACRSDLAGFGDKATTDQSVFPLFDEHANPGGCAGIEGVLKEYAARIPNVQLAGPTSFAPAIHKTIELVKAAKARELTICLIIADGVPGNTSAAARAATEAAIVEASKYPVVVVIVGVGDGPWGGMDHFDDSVKGRRFDNFNFVELNKISGKAAEAKIGAAGMLAMECLSELPSAYKECTRLGLLGRKKW
jgi:E3 ubiquitin-protein ligase RGLG